MHVVALNALPEVEELAREGSLRFERRALSQRRPRRRLPRLRRDGGHRPQRPGLPGGRGAHDARQRRRRAAALQLHHARDRAHRADLDRRLDARRQPGARQAPAHARSPSATASRTRGSPSCSTTSAAGPGTRCRRIRIASSSSRASCTRSPTPSSSCARATSRPCATSSRRTCTRSRAPVPRPDASRASRPSSRASRSARSARPSACSARPIRRSSAPKRRRSGAPTPRAYLNARAGRAPLLLVGEAMGYAGGRFTGIAFTAERTLRSWGAPYAGHERAARGLGRAVGDDRARCARGRSGSAPRRCSGTSCPRTRTGPGEPLSNRTPAVGELRAGAEVLGELIERLRAARDRRRRPQRRARARRARPGLRRRRAPSRPTAARRPSAPGSRRYGCRRADVWRAWPIASRSENVRSISTSAMPPSTAFEIITAACIADREREQLRVAGRAAEHDDDQRLLRPDAARRDRQQCRERPDDHHEQRVAQRARDARTPPGTPAAEPMRQAQPSELRDGNRGEVALRRAQDREALPYARRERLAGGLHAPHGEHAGEQDERRDDRGDGRVRDRPRPFERGYRGQLRHARQRVLREREGEDQHAQHDIEQRLDEQRGQDRGRRGGRRGACA